MPRPRKCRRVCCLPKITEFSPIDDKKNNDETVILTVDEYETIRLIDKEGLSQQECCENMNIARTTVQQIYTTAREKIAHAIVDGLSLRIEGGDYKVCDGIESCCCKHRCFRRKCNAKRNNKKI